jgi:hypothetical protein
MSSFNTVVQEVIYAKLVADIAYPVYDDKPQDDSAFPYVTIGEDNYTFADTDTELMCNASITINTWSRYRGREEIKQMQDAIYNSLHRADLTATGYNFVTITQDSAISFYDADGITRHGVQTFNLLIEEL